MDSFIALEQHARQWQRLLDTLALATRMPGAYVARCCSVELHVLATSSDCPVHTDCGARLPIFNLYCEQVMRQGQPVIIEDGSTDPNWSGSREQQAGIFSFIGYPIHAPDGSVFGTLGLYDAQPRRVKSAWRELMRAVVTIIERELKQYEDRQLLLLENRTDALTGLSNQQGLRMAQESLRIWGQSLCEHFVERSAIGVVWLKVEGLNRIAEQFEPGLTDIILQHIALQLKQGIRKHDLAVRWRDDQFLLLLPAISASELQNRGEGVRQRLQEQAVQTQQGPLLLSLSVATAVWDGHGELPLTLAATG
ncbi:diguanylate cyclase [uncultured Ferrimonas sp.]|uniref:diguanylate cyclase domain-containing protein n=1 Tax=uncultured Ferrimonas sp. TaxID=432640 RepID=UPI00260CCA04|nr:diguanylate cyclase [uncultured Ferrimonas sp.]